MKKLLVLTCFMAVGLIAFSQKKTNFTIEVSNDSILLGNYIEVKFMIENTSVINFEPPSFEGFDIVSGPNQSSSMMISNGIVKQSITYSYYVEPLDIGNYFIDPAYVETEDGPLESIPLEVLVVDNPEGIIQKPQQKNDLFGGDNFFGGNDLFNDFFSKERNPFFQEIEPSAPNKKSQPKKKKRKVYKL